mmetsp:Transcript_16291/g.35207  ORF Transcript_16291/g.35207 Transcript_16291/m.35207 type:complete len:220 (-) Transcript_16291:4-663(-)
MTWPHAASSLPLLAVMRIITSSKLPTSTLGRGARSTLSALTLALSILALALEARASREVFSRPVALLAWTWTWLYSSSYLFALSRYSLIWAALRCLYALCTAMSRSSLHRKSGTYCVSCVVTVRPSAWKTGTPTNWRVGTPASWYSCRAWPICLMSGMKRKWMPCSPVWSRGVVNTSYTLSMVTRSTLESRARRGFSSRIFSTIASASSFRKKKKPSAL